MKQYKNEIIYQLKAIAIFCVICAHCGNRVSNSEVTLFMDQIRYNIAGIGVPIFFMVSGYLFNNNKPFGAFWKGKLEHVVLPWLFWGTAVWGYEVIRKGLSYVKLWEWLLGVNTYLWFLPTIMIFWFVYYFAKKSWIKNFFLGVILVAYVTVNYVPVNYQAVNISFVNNILDNAPFFATGVFLKDYANNFDMNKVGLLHFLSVIVLLIIWYFAFGRIERLLVIEGCVILFLLLVDKLKNETVKKWLIDIGIDSYVIYLVHMPAAGLVSNLFSRSLITQYLVFIQPVIVIIMVEAFIYFLRLFIIKSQGIETVTGLKNAQKVK